MTLAVPKYKGEERYFPLKWFWRAQIWVDEGGVSVMEIFERTGRNRSEREAPHVRAWGKSEQMHTWASQHGWVWAWRREDENQQVCFEMSGAKARRQLLRYGVTMPETLLPQKAAKGPGE